MVSTCDTPNMAISDLLSQCFQGGERISRELRLSQEDAQYIAETYNATVRPMGGQWYEITFMGVK